MNETSCGFKYLSVCVSVPFSKILEHVAKITSNFEVTELLVLIKE